MRTYLIAATALLATVGCAPLPQQPKSNISQDYEESLRSNEALCETRVRSVPGIESMLTKFPFTANLQPSIDMLGNNQKPNDAEKLILIELDKATIYCNELDVSLHTSSQFSQYLPSTVLPFRQERFAAARNLRVDLILGKLTYGQYAKARYDTNLTYMIKGAALKDQAKALSLQQQQVQAQQAQAIAAQQQRNDQLLQQSLDLMRRSTPVAPPPRNITCSTFGRHTDCTAF